ncbi:ketoacyl-synthetase-like protein [Paenibacillus cellulosilyticus]|uniref:Ketoacyl-synthetase-like protein n=1 Tax=Paenibacillus cellulosilyticus TaxID=375489 RepID=A0A2V2YZ92_9BACL|nr:beta-ketoacyl synthase N-terminal-like domain-containing protein [Paenibacillus cellulosilyticus]PWW06591.1 ketoacyl-synthetase-like protein [Paenibacillus cellulosilyticus]QKS46081.1 AMP-binding protein [Paenibacillus cellulosilyticus]
MTEHQLGFDTLTEMFTAKDIETERGITFVSGKSEEVYCSFHEIYRKALSILGYLQSEGIRSKDKLVFQLDENYEFIHVFWACMLGGIIAVPIVSEDKNEYKRKLYNVLTLLENAYVIGHEDSLPKLREYAEQEGADFELINKRFVDVKEALRYVQEGQIYHSLPEDTAFIQFSSGSTGTPKGVVLTHSNLIFNFDAFGRGIQLTRDDTVVTWMPMTHDMGLIGFHLTMTAYDVEQCSINTQLFVVKPSLWLEKITKHKATVLGSPNFGLKYTLLALERNRNKSEYDLSAVRVIINGAEPISVKVCDEFNSKLAPYGLRESAMFPAYGLAEATLAVAFSELNEPKIIRHIIHRHSLKIGEPVLYLEDADHPAAITVVDEGYAVRHCEFRICDLNNQVLEQDCFGMIQVRGASVSGHYYSNQEATDAARTEDGWFITGDLGFMRNGRLACIGRSQEMVIVNGQNYYSNDLERIASEVDKISLNRVAICSTIDPDTQLEQILAFVVHKGNPAKFIPVIHSLREHFTKAVGIRLDHVIPVTQIPKTSSGKLMRFSLRDQFNNGDFTEVMDECNRLIAEERQFKKREQVTHPSDTDAAAMKPRAALREIELEILSICSLVAPELNIGLDDNFFQYGINSLSLSLITAHLDDKYPGRITKEDFFKYSTVHKLASYMAGIEERQSPKPNVAVAKTIPNNDNPRFAIIGMSAIVPGASNIHEFWGNLCGGIESVGSLPNSRVKDIEDYYRSMGYENAPKMKTGGYIDDIDTFDFEFFKILKKEAIAMSPTQRLFLETAYTAMEDAGYGGAALKSSRTGVYVGYISDLDGYQYQDMLKHSLDSRSGTGGLSANISGRLSYFMDFKGPSVLVDSACSASMSALSMACMGLINGDCEQAIVGGVQLKLLPIDDGYRVGIESSDGHTRPFAEEADGTGEGEGVVAILIKPYEQALADKDHMYAIIRTLSTNQDGHSVGLSAPNPQAQTELVLKALEKTGLGAEDISYIEAHGTGTRLGDPIEIHALTDAFKIHTNRTGFCAIGSVKSNIGHLYASSGLTSIIKCSMMLKHKAIPATINIETVNKQISFEDSPYYLNREYKPWLTEALPRRCGVSNFGFSGTNCHTILEEYVEDEQSELPGEWFPFVLSASTRSGLLNLANQYYHFLLANDGTRLSDICFTASLGRGHGKYRLAIAARDTRELIYKLGKFDGSSSFSDQICVGEVRVVEDVRNGVQWGELTKSELGQLNAAAKQYITIYLEQGEASSRKTLIERLCGLYVRGSEPCWEDLFAGVNCRRTSLPTFLFNKTRCWPEFQNILVKQAGC